MNQIDYFLEKSSETTWESLELKVKELEIDASLDTLQVVSINPYNPRMEGLAWYVRSKSMKAFNGAVTKYLGDDESRKFENSLLFKELDSAPYWYEDWNHKTSEAKVSNPNDQVQYTSNRSDKNVFEYSEKSTDLDSLLDFWKLALSSHYKISGSTMWISIPHIQSNNTNLPLTSSAFVVFNGKIPDETKRYRLARLLRDQMIGYLIDVFQLHIDRQHDYYADLFSEYLAKQSSEIVMTPSVNKQIESLKSVIRASIPVLIEGEPGTGKYTAALHVAKLAPGVSTLIQDNSEDQNLVNKLILSINCRGENTDQNLVEKLESISNINSKATVLIIDNLESLSKESQGIVVAFLEDQIFGTKRVREHKKAPFLLFTIGGNINDALSSNSIIPELYSRIGTFSIQLPTLLERIHSRSRKDDRITFMKDLTDKTMEKLLPLLPNQDEAVEISESELSKFIHEPWPGNYVELRQRVLQIALLDKNRY